MKVQVKTPPTANQKTHVLVPGDVVLRQGEFWEVVKIEAQDGDPDHPTGVLVHLRNGEGDEQQVLDGSCWGLQDVHPEISNKYMWWRVVNMGA